MIVKTDLIDDKLCEVCGYNTLKDFTDEHSECEIFDLYFIDKLIKGNVVYVFLKNEKEFMYDENIETLELFAKYFNFPSDTTVKSNILEELGIIDKKIKINMENVKTEIVWVTSFSGWCKIYETIDSFENGLGRKLTEIENSKILQHWDENSKVWVFFTNGGMNIANSYQRLYELSSNDIDSATNTGSVSVNGNQMQPNVVEYIQPNIENVESTVNDDPMVKYQKEFSLERGSIIKQAFEKSENFIYWYADIENDFFTKFESVETFETWLGVKLDEIDSANIYTLLYTGRDVYGTKFLDFTDFSNAVAFSDSLENLKIKLGYENVNKYNDKKPFIYWYSDLKNNVFKKFENIEEFGTRIHRQLTEFETSEIIKILKSDLNAFVYFISDRLIVASNYKILCSFVKNSEMKLDNPTVVKKPFIFFYSNLENDIRAKFENVEEFEKWLYRNLSKDEHTIIENLLKSNEDVFVTFKLSGVYSDDFIFANNLESLKTNVEATVQKPFIHLYSDFNYYKNFVFDLRFDNIESLETWLCRKLTETEHQNIENVFNSGANAFVTNSPYIGYERDMTVTDSLESLKTKVIELKNAKFENNLPKVETTVENLTSGVNTTIQKIRKTCKNTFLGKLKEYGATWLYYRTPSMLEQIESKLNRLKNKVLIVNESRLETWQSIYNYCLIVLMMNDNRIDYTELYKELSEKSENIRIEKNKDYSDSWQAFHEQTIIDIIFAKLKRITNLVNHDSENVLNEKHISDIIDMANYAIYGAFKNS